MCSVEVGRIFFNCAVKKQEAHFYIVKRITASMLLILLHFFYITTHMTILVLKSSHPIMLKDTNTLLEPGLKIGPDQSKHWLTKIDFGHTNQLAVSKS